MLVDLGRNDLGRVCDWGSVEVVDFMSVERYSHVMHIVSTVVGRLAPGRSAYDVLAATFPAGTLSGAPKPRAMELIEKLEPTRRALYGGAVGYLDFAGDLDLAIAIRTALLMRRRRRTSRPAAASSPTPTRSPRTRSRATRPPRSCARSRWRAPCARSRRDGPALLPRCPRAAAARGRGHPRLRGSRLGQCLGGGDDRLDGCGRARRHRSRRVRRDPGSRSARARRSPGGRRHARMRPPGGRRLPLPRRSHRHRPRRRQRRRRSA